MQLIVKAEAKMLHTELENYLFYQSAWKLPILFVAKNKSKRRDTTFKSRR